MRITYTAASPKAGITEHIDNLTGRVLVASGLATEYKYANYRERLAAEFSSASGAGHTDPNVVAVEWGVKDRAQSPFSQVSIIKRRGSETTFYSTPPNDCPPSIVARWSELMQVENPDVVSERLLELKNKLFTQHSEEKKGVLATIFGGGK